MPLKSALFLGLVGALLGGALDLNGAMAGFALGASWAIFRAQSARIDALEGALAELTARPWPTEPARPAPAPEPVPRPAPVRTPEPGPVAAPPPRVPPMPRPAPPPPPLPTPAAAVPAPAPAVWEAPDFLQTLVAFFTTGNLVAKVGVVILFFGVAFLLSFAAERGLLPIEFRLDGHGGRGRRHAGRRVVAAADASGLRQGGAGRRGRHPLPDRLRRLSTLRARGRAAGAGVAAGGGGA